VFFVTVVCGYDTDRCSNVHPPFPTKSICNRISLFVAWISNLSFGLKFHMTIWLARIPVCSFQYGTVQAGIPNADTTSLSRCRCLSHVCDPKALVFLSLEGSQGMIYIISTSRDSFDLPGWCSSSGG
jgi:hypothetical protein